MQTLIFNRTHALLILNCVMAFLLGSASHVIAASFNCNNSITKAETAICSDPALSKLDEDLGVVYSLHSKLVDDKGSLQAQQRKWLVSRDTQTSKTWLYSTISQRISALIEEFDFQRCLSAGFGALHEDCFRVFRIAASNPKEINFLRISDGSSIRILKHGIEYLGTFSQEALDFSYDWQTQHRVFISWSADTGLILTNTDTNETVKIYHMLNYQDPDNPTKMQHPIRTAGNNCYGWALNPPVSAFCHWSEIDLWKLEVQRLLHSQSDKDEILASLNHILDTVRNPWSRRDIIANFAEGLETN